MVAVEIGINNPNSKGVVKDKIITNVSNSIRDHSSTSNNNITSLSNSISNRNMITDNNIIIIKEDTEVVVVAAVEIVSKAVGHKEEVLQFLTIKNDRMFSIF